jgi:release factor glutamine methyltransferase
MTSNFMAATDRAAIITQLRAAGCVWAEDEADLLISAASTPAHLQSSLARRVDGEPLEHILGWAWFSGIRVMIAPGVFVPRARTGLLVRAALTLVDHRDAVVLDLCCGSGAVSAAVAAKAPGTLRVSASDVDTAAVACARLNLRPWGGQVYQGDLFAALPAHLRGRVDVLVANVPYVPTAQIGMLPREARLYESLLALDGGADGLDLLRRVATEVPRWLAPRGHIIVETSQAQSPTAAEVLHRAGLAARVVTDAQLDATAVIATR